ncbi:MAG TPA: hypothetical protein VGR77_08625 [Candidatus Dormibacteraeota bacterium]|nr:hypothetical protein [Candidatus Dormibacteraeota bacterium]
MSRPDRKPRVAVDFAPQRSRGARPLLLLLLVAVVLGGLAVAVTQLLLD